MARNVDERIPENLFINMMIEKANIIKDHLNCKKNTCPLIIVVNIGPTMAVFKFYDTTEEDDSLKLRMTLSNLGDIDEPDTYFVAASKLSVTTILFSMWES